MTTVKIEENDDGELYVVIPDDIVEELGLKPGDTLILEVEQPIGEFPSLRITPERE